jgi:hypothetical protein
MFVSALGSEAGNLRSARWRRGASSWERDTIAHRALLRTAAFVGRLPR